MLIQYHDNGPDERGRRTFTLFWLADYHPGHPGGEYRRAWRGQVFHSDPRAIGGATVTTTPPTMTI